MVVSFLDLEPGANTTRYRDLDVGVSSCHLAGLIHMVDGPPGALGRVMGACEVAISRMNVGSASFWLQKAAVDAKKCILWSRRDPIVSTNLAYKLGEARRRSHHALGVR